MWIGINLLYLLPDKVGGTETYVRELLSNLEVLDNKNRYFIFTNIENDSTFDFKSPNFLKIRCNVSAKNKFLRTLYEQLIFPIIIKKNKIDILHSPGYVTPIFGNCIKITTIHDLQYIHYPNFFSKIKLWYWKLFIPLSVKYSDVILTVSQSSTDDILNNFNISPNKVFYTHLASRMSKIRSNGKSEILDIFHKYKIEKKYLLSVASLLPHKNIDNLTKAFDRISVERQLVLVGGNDGLINDIKSKIVDKIKNLQNIIFTGYLDKSTLKSLYENADLFVLPSLFEGFGIPLLEAMSVGCPVAASDRTSIPEVVGDAAVLFNPEDVDNIVDSIEKVLLDQNLRKELIYKGYNRSTEFSWEKMTKETLDIYNHIYHV